MLNACAILLAALPGLWQISYGHPDSPIKHTISGLSYSDCIVLEGQLRNYAQTDPIEITPCEETPTTNSTDDSPPASGDSFLRNVQ